MILIAVSNKTYYKKRKLKNYKWKFKKIRKKFKVNLKIINHCLNKQKIYIKKKNKQRYFQKKKSPTVKQNYKIILNKIIKIKSNIPKKKQFCKIVLII